MNLLMWVVVGLVAGWLAGFIMKQGGYRRKEGILLGLVGSLVGGIVGPWGSLQKRGWSRWRVSRSSGRSS